MKKLILCSILSILFFNTYSQDTSCVYFHEEEVHLFNYYTSEILSSIEQTEEFIEISVDSNEVLCIHLSDRKISTREVFMYYSDGKWSRSELNSKDNAYYTPIGPLVVEVGRSKLKL